LLARGRRRGSTPVILLESRVRFVAPDVSPMRLELKVLPVKLPARSLPAPATLLAMIVLLMSNIPADLLMPPPFVPAVLEAIVLFSPANFLD
jgi:hypothetical protein